VELRRPRHRPWVVRWSSDWLRSVGLAGDILTSSATERLRTASKGWCVAPDYTKARAFPRRVLVAQDQANVYTRPDTPEGERARWNVWDMTAAKGRRVELEPWAMGVLSPHAATAVDTRSSTEGTD
jgi:hypothetical protein